MSRRARIFNCSDLPLMLSALLLVGLAGCATTKPVPALPPPDPRPFGSVWVDAGRHELIVSGYVNQVVGAIELFACGPGGKTHESVLVLFADAPDIQAGLLLLGLQHGEPMAGLGQGPPEGDAVRIRVDWDEAGRIRSHDAGALIKDMKRGKNLRNAPWIFNGSKIENNYFLANAEDSLIATYWDPWAIINIALPVGIDDERLAPDEKELPPRLTPVRVVITPERAP